MKKVIEVVASHDEAARTDVVLWASQSPSQRLQHALDLRRINYGKDRVSSRLRRILEITQRPELFEDPNRIVRMGEAPLRIEILMDIDGVTFDDCASRSDSQILTISKIFPDSYQWVVPGAPL